MILAAVDRGSSHAAPGARRAAPARGAAGDGAGQLAHGRGDGSDSATGSRSLFVHLPVAEPDAGRRYLLTVAETEELKRGIRPAAAPASSRSAGSPRRSCTRLRPLGLGTRLFNITVTNVPGPQVPLYAFGARMEEVSRWSRSRRDHAVGVAVVSYDGRVFFGLNGDERAIAGPGRPRRGNRDRDHGAGRARRDRPRPALARLSAVMAVSAGSKNRARITVFNLFVAFAFTIMADPVSSVAYALEAALGGLDGDLESLFPTMALVIGVIALVAAGYHGLIAYAFRMAVATPRGSPRRSAKAGRSCHWALLVDFTLTIAVSCAAGASAVIAYVPELAGLRVPLALALVLAVGAGTLLGHRARVVFATATLAFVGCLAGRDRAGLRSRLRPPRALP